MCFLFSDVAGFATLTEQYGDRRAFRVLVRHHRIVRAACRRAGGRELEVRGDGFLLAFERADGALACAVEIQRALEADRGAHPDEPIRVHMGVHAGSALRTGRHFFGKSLVVAARLADLARPDEILASDSLEDALRAPQIRASGVRFGFVRWTRLRGLRGRFRYRPVRWRPAPSPVALDALHPMRRVEALAAWLEEALAPALPALRARR